MPFLFIDKNLINILIIKNIESNLQKQKFYKNNKIILKHTKTSNKIKHKNN